MGNEKYSLLTHTHRKLLTPREALGLAWCPEPVGLAGRMLLEGPPACVHCARPQGQRWSGSADGDLPGVVLGTCRAHSLHRPTWKALSPVYRRDLGKLTNWAKGVVSDEAGFPHSKACAFFPSLPPLEPSRTSGKRIGTPCVL